MEKETLHSYFLNNGKKIIHKWIHYFDIYEKHFRNYVDKEMLMIEIGVFNGGSLQMWKNYFGNKCKIVGIDIDPNCKQHESVENNIFVEIGNQSDINFLDSVIKKYGKPDIILDDGSHVMSDLIKSFNFLYYQMKDEGIYFVEDLHTCYWPQFEGGYKTENTFIEFVKDKTDELNAFHFRKTNEITEFTRITQSISLYDSIAVFDKKPQGVRFAIQTGKMN